MLAGAMALVLLWIWWITLQHTRDVARALRFSGPADHSRGG